jgi:hypothetical protein
MQVPDQHRYFPTCPTIFKNVPLRFADSNGRFAFVTRFCNPVA